MGERANVYEGPKGFQRRNDQEGKEIQLFLVNGERIENGVGCSGF